LRASDADRDRVAERLRKAAGEGRLLVDELEQRLEAAFRARTYGQLDALLADLPGRRLTPVPRGRARGGGQSLARPAFALALAVTAVTLVALVAIFVLTGIFAGWVLWMLFGWFFFARRRHRACRAPRRSVGPPASRWDGGRGPSLSA
jgi:Flp pilus assembly protein TadB